MKLHLTILMTFLLITVTRAQIPDKLVHPNLMERVWYKNALIYNLEVGVFKDSDGNGRGDLAGVINKLDYLKALGVDVIWLAPFFPSPGRDDGYDVADFYAIDPELGDHGYFNELVRQAKMRGMRVILDLVINHTSDEHPWFKKARDDKNSNFRNWYIWSEKRPRDWNKGMVFPGVQKAVWTLDSLSGEYYYHRFYKFQPDLNYTHPAVTEEIHRMIAFWLQTGIDGFRIDAVPFVLELPHSASEKPKLDYEFLYKLRQFTSLYNAEAIILGEANVPPEENKTYFGPTGNGLQMMFNFFLNQHLFYALATGDTQLLSKSLEDSREIPETAQWANFLRNHDEIDLGRLTDKQRQKVYDKFGPDTSMQVYDRGIRRRLAPMLQNPHLIRMAYSLLFSLPGTPVLRYGEEIGMGDDLSLKERLAVRTPMQWDSSYNAGFSTADSLRRPVINDPEYGYKKVNVAQQLADSTSLLYHIKQLAALRKMAPEIGKPNYQILKSKQDNVLILQYDTLLVIHNFCNCENKITLADYADLNTQLLFAKDGSNATSQSLTDIRLSPYDYRWYKLK